MKFNDRIFGLAYPSTSKVYIIFPSKLDFVLQVNARHPFWRIQKSVMLPFFTIISSGWHIFLLTSSAKVNKLLFERLFKNPSPSNNILFAYFLYYLCICLGKNYITSSRASCSKVSLIWYDYSMKFEIFDSISLQTSFYLHILWKVFNFLFFDY